MTRLTALIATVLSFSCSHGVVVVGGAARSRRSPLCRCTASGNAIILTLSSPIPTRIWISRENNKASIIVYFVFLCTKELGIFKATFAVPDPVAAAGEYKLDALVQGRSVAAMPTTFTLAPRENQHTPLIINLFIYLCTLMCAICLVTNTPTVFDSYLLTNSD